MRLICKRFKCCPHKMFLAAPSGYSYDHSPAILIPIWRTKSCKCRNHIHPIGIRHRLCIFLWLCRAIYHAQLISQPLYRSTGNEHTSLQCIAWFLIRICRYGCYQAILRLKGSLSRVHQQKTACPIRVLHIAFTITALPEQCRLLISCCPCELNLTT